MTLLCRCHRLARRSTTASPSFPGCRTSCTPRPCPACTPRRPTCFATTFRTFSNPRNNLYFLSSLRKPKRSSGRMASSARLAPRLESPAGGAGAALPPLKPLASATVSATRRFVPSQKSASSAVGIRDGSSGSMNSASWRSVKPPSFFVPLRAMRNPTHLSHSGVLRSCRFASMGRMVLPPPERNGWRSACVIESRCCGFSHMSALASFHPAWPLRSSTANPSASSLLAFRSCAARHASRSCPFFSR
mmetsp:Transcript_13275/g.43746  ORF Transcript_13275/g.43746 Transcript_13275/m.43746 type:complete len:247 (+) Transcript_13275:241-981(+)